ncbi:MAG TPA: hypothetical protein VJ558_01200 [Bacillales bacterium]|nr:hypothetical protein [Bacillales bacterium]
MDQFTPDESKTLRKWQNKLQTSLSSFNNTIMDEREQIYLGTRQVDGNVNSNKTPTKKANNIYNVVFEMIESQVNSTIPQPAVKAKRPGFETQAKMIEDSITNDLKEIGIEEINDINERITPIQGFSIITVDWDPDFKHHLYRGEIKVSSKHPKQLIPQPGVYHIQKMDYFFILSSVTKEYIKRRYDIDLASQDKEQYPEINSALGEGKQNTEGEKVTEIVCWYKDQDGEIGKFVWTNDTVLEDLPKFFYRRIDGQIQEKETLISDVTLADGTIIPAGTEVPYFMPTRYPVVIRKNVPKNFAFEGQSDVDTIRDQQDSIKKVGTKIEEKVLKSGSLITVPDDLHAEITNETYQIIRANAQQALAINTKDLTAPIERDLNYIDQQRQVVQYMLGITDSFQGQEDTTAKSGIAKQIQVQQSSGRMRSKEFNKQTAFKELFEIMFEFKLAFYDELRPYLAKDADGKDLFGDFDKYQFLMKDAAGEYFYNTDFLFSADNGAGIPKDAIFLYNQSKEMLGSGALNIVQFWTIMESLNFPMAKEIKSQVEDQQQNQQPQQDIPSLSISFKDLPPSGQAQMAALAGIQLNPNELQAQEMAQNTDGQQPNQIEQLISQLSPEEQQQFAQMPVDQQQALIQQLLGGQNNG